MNQTTTEALAILTEAKPFIDYCDCCATIQLVECVLIDNNHFWHCSDCK
jgi:hypothetical protein